MNGLSARHDVGDVPVAVEIRVWCRASSRALSQTLGLVSFTICSQKSTPTKLSWKMLWSNMYSAASPRFTIHSRDRGGTNSERHVLGVGGAGGVVIAADAADAAGDEVRVARVFTLHEDAVTAEDRRRAMTLRDLPVFEIDLGENPQAARRSG